MDKSAAKKKTKHMVAGAIESACCTLSGARADLRFARLAGVVTMDEWRDMDDELGRAGDLAETVVEALLGESGDSDDEE